MAIVHADNFSIYDTNVGLMTQGIYAEVSGSSALVSDPDGISAGRVYQQVSSAASQAVLRYVLPTSQSTTGVALRVWMNNLPVIEQDRPRIVSFRDGSNVETAYVIIETTGRFTFYDGTNTITTTNPVITANGWWHVEVKYVTAGTGSIEIRVEGITVMQNTNLGYLSMPNVFQIAQHYFGFNFGSTVVYWKDYIIWDDTGTNNNNFLGTVMVTQLLPMSDVALNWTPSTGSTGYTILDNIPPDDSMYLAAPFPAPAAYQAGLTNLPKDVTSVKALISIIRAAKTDGGDGNIQVSIVSDPLGTPATVDGADRPITTAQTYWRDVFEIDPKTGAPWTPIAVDNANLKINRTL